MKQIILQEHSKNPIMINLSDQNYDEILEYKNYLESIVEKEVENKRL